jgi:hypothetical protein
MRRVFLLAVLLLTAAPALACRPAYDPRPYTVRMQQERDFFLGTVTHLYEQQVTFKIITPGGPARDLTAGASMTFPRGEYGTCGRKQFALGETWLFNGKDIALSLSTPVDPQDLKDGNDISVVVKNLTQRVEPDYVPPRVPVKEDLPVPGTYTSATDCSAEQKTLGHDKAIFSLTISAPDPATNLHTVTIESRACNSDASCRFTGQAPPYGYGEIVMPVKPGEPAHANCSFVIHQISAEDEWPKLAPEETGVRLNDYRCKELLGSCGTALMQSPPLKLTSPQ